MLMTIKERSCSHRSNSDLIPVFIQLLYNSLISTSPGRRPTYVIMAKLQLSIRSSTCRSLNRSDISSPPTLAKVLLKSFLAAANPITSFLSLFSKKRADQLAA